MIQDDITLICLTLQQAIQLSHNKSKYILFETMGSIEWIMDKHVRPYNAKERTYAIFGQKLMEQDSEFYNNYIEVSLNNLKTKLQFFFLSLTLTITIFLILIFSSEEYWSLLMKLTAVSMLVLGYAYIISSFNYIVIGIYERAWIKLLVSKNLTINPSIFQNITGKTTSKIYPKVKSYLITNNLSTSISENDIRSISPLSIDPDKLKSEHIKFENSTTKFKEII